VHRVADDDWRVTVALRDVSHTTRLRLALHEQEVEDEVRERLGSRVAVGQGDGTVFLYAGTREAAREAERVVREILLADDLEADLAIDRWHPIEERWEDERVPLPTADTDRESEQRRREADEIAQSEDLGAGLWEVRIELASHHDAVALAEHLEAQRDSLVPGWTVSIVRRWKYLLIGADSDEQASRIAERIEPMLPPGASIQVEPSGALAWQTMRTSPFAVFGGLGA
jgi:hypothetical protein